MGLSSRPIPISRFAFAGERKINRAVGPGGGGRGGVAVASANAEEHPRSDVLNETKLGEERSAELAYVKAAIKQTTSGEENIAPHFSFRHHPLANKLLSVSRP